jgi:pimeloyl-ACP methyl ester carboxylesterase
VASPEEVAKSTIPFIMAKDFIESNPDYVKHATERLVKTPITRDAQTRQVKAWAGWDTYARLPEIKAPTLVIQGKKDILNPPENAKIIADRIPGAKLVYLEKSAHFLSEEIDKLVNTLLEFLA